MNNISINSENVFFTSPSGYFLVFDILFSEKLRDKKKLFENKEPINIQKIESQIFEWSDGELLALYEVNKNSVIEIKLSQIKYYDEEYFNINTDNIFGTDTGVIVLIDWHSIPKFLDIFNYDSFIDELPLGSFSINNSSYELNNTFAIISTPGLGKDCEFSGSGRYFIEI